MTQQQLRLEAAGYSKPENVAGYPVGRWIAADVFDAVGIRAQSCAVYPGTIKGIPGRKTIDGIDRWGVGR